VGLLESGRDLDGLGRTSYVVGRPLAVAVAEPGRELTRVLGPEHLPTRWPGDPLRGAADLLERLRPAAPAAGFCGGGVLTLSYDLGRRYERLPAEAHADHRAPDLHLAVYENVLAIDHHTGEIERRGRLDAGVGLSADEVAQALRQVEDPLEALPDDEAPPPSSLEPEAYRQAVAQASRLIRRGDLFEVNLTRRHAIEGVDPDRCYRRLRELAPAAFMADLELGSGRRLLSASPERFLRLDAAGRVEAWPIKGTRPRGATPEADAALRAELLGSEKEAAELAMIVDLMRNDLGRVARPGTVRVAEPRGVQSWPTVHHTVARVEAELDAGRDWADLVRASFPPGSVTGAPKIRAMEVIDRLEPVRRGLYCGAFGYVGWDGCLDLAVAIRVVACEGSRALVHAGGAILLDSDPAAEEREAALKARALWRAAQGAR
jgi:para-aminobenzoate synthetase component 1